MDFSTTIAGVLLTAGCVTPVVLLVISKHRKHRKLLDRFRVQARAYSLDITEYEVWRNRIIGIDSVKKQVLYMDIGHSANFIQLIDLSHVEQCKIHEWNRDEDGRRLLDRLTLELRDKRAWKDPDVLEFYNSQREARADREQPRIQRWAVTINKCLRASHNFANGFARHA